MDIKQDNFFPQIHYFDTDYVSIYEQTWARIETQWVAPSNTNTHVPKGYIDYPNSPTIDLNETAYSSFFLLYSNGYLSTTAALDFFYRKQESSGAIRNAYDKTTGEVHFTKDNPEGLAPPILVWAEHNIYNRTDNKRRIKDILPKLDEYLHWLSSLTLQPNGLFTVPPAACGMHNFPRLDAHYFIDFNAQMALAFSLMIKLASTANLRNLVFKYTKSYYNLKAKMNECFWDEEQQFYFDLDAQLKPVRVKTLPSYWTLIAKIPNNSQAEALRDSLKNPEEFATLNAFPAIAKNHPHYSHLGLGYRGSVYPILTYMVVKGLTGYGFYEFARESAIRHISSVLATYYENEDTITGDFWEAYQPNNYLPAKGADKSRPMRINYFPSIAMSTITLMIEDIIGFDICLPKKMVYWTIPHLEFMGIESFQLKKNMISTILQQNNRGWEIRHGSEKLYYFSVDIIEKNIKKTLPIPSGKCSLLIDKL